MPSNFSDGLDTRAAPSLVVDKPVSDYSDNISQAGRAFNALGEAYASYKEDKEKANLGTFSADLASVESGAADYAGRLRELYLQTEGADAAKIKQIQDEINRIHAGEIQGVYNPTKAKVHIDNLVKSYSSQHPLLAKDIRTMANAAKGNLSQILNDELGLDPYVKNVIDRYGAAKSKGMSPQEFEMDLRANEQADSALKRAQVDQAIGEVTKQKITKNAQMFGSAKSNTSYLNIVNTFEQSIRNGQVPTAEMLTGYIANESQRVRWDIENYVQSSYGNPNDGSYSFSNEDYNSVMKPTEEAFSNLTKFLTSSALLPEQKLKILKMNNDLRSEQSVTDMWSNNSELGQYVARAQAVFGKDTAGTFIAGAIAWDSKIAHARGAGQDPEKNLRNEANTLMLAGKVVEAAALLNQLDNQNPALTGASVMNFVAGLPYDTGNVRMNATAVAKGITSFIQATPEAKTLMAPGMLSNMSWERLVKTPDVSAHVANDRNLIPFATAKATSHVLSTLANSGSSVDAVTFDPARGINAFNYKQPIGISKERVDAILELNRTYSNMLRIFGADVTADWVNALVQPDTQHGLSKDGNFGLPKKKEIDRSGLDMGEPMSHVLDVNKETYGLPEELVLALGFRESSLGKNLVSPTSSAKGPLAIIDSTFNTINQRDFGGKLNPDDMNDRGVAALANLNEIYRRNGGDLTKTLLEHFSGSPAGWSVVDANGVSGVQFVTEVFNKMREYQSG